MDSFDRAAVILCDGTVSSAERNSANEYLLNIQHNPDGISLCLQKIQSYFKPVPGATSPEIVVFVALNIITNALKELRVQRKCITPDNPLFKPLTTMPFEFLVNVPCSQCLFSFQQQVFSCSFLSYFCFCFLSFLNLNSNKK